MNPPKLSLNTTTLLIHIHLHTAWIARSAHRFSVERSGDIDPSERPPVLHRLAYPPNAKKAEPSMFCVCGCLVKSISVRSLAQPLRSPTRRLCSVQPPPLLLCNFAPSLFALRHEQQHKFQLNYSHSADSLAIRCPQTWCGHQHATAYT